MQLRKRARAGPDPVRHEVVVDLFAERHDLSNLVAGDKAQRGFLRLFHVCGILYAFHAKGDLLPRELCEIAPAEEVTSGKPTREVIDRSALHHRVVDVEERS